MGPAARSAPARPAIGVRVRRGIVENGVFVAETYTGAVIHKNRKVEGGSFLGQSPTEIVELAVAWCEQVMAEIEREARDRGVALA
jgi:hypothetical protein